MNDSPIREVSFYNRVAAFPDPELMSFMQLGSFILVVQGIVGKTYEAI